jgi:hypothetical protein
MTSENESTELHEEKSYKNSIKSLGKTKDEGQLSECHQPVVNNISKVKLTNYTNECYTAAELEYLGYWITQNGVKPLSKKVEAITNLAPPKT